MALSGLALLTLVSAGYFLCSAPRFRPMPGLTHVYELAERANFLSEELALNYARQSLKEDGLNPAEWLPVRNGHTKAPDGRVDAFMARTTGTPNRGVILFTRAGCSPKFVAVELQGSRVICQNTFGR